MDWILEIKERKRTTECEWAPEQRDLGGLGLTGICRETKRVVLRVILPNFRNLGSPLLATLLLGNVTLSRALSSRVLGEGSSLLRLIADLAALSLTDAGCVLLFFLCTAVGCVLIFLLCTAAYVLCITSLYRTGGDLRAADRVLNEDPPVVPLTRDVSRFFLVAIPCFVVFASLSLPSMHRIGDKILLPLWLLGWVSAAYVAVVCQMACVVLVLEDATLFGALRRSRELLAGKFWAAAYVFVTLDGCVIVLLKAFPALVVDDALGRGLWVQMAAWLAIDLALDAVLVVTLVAQPVVYMVCKSHHQEVVDMAHPHLD